jgi:hypothetical protein
VGNDQHLNDKKFEKIWLAGVWTLAAFHIWDTYRILWDNFHFDWYRVMQAEMPDWLVCVRFVFSTALRILILWAVVGVFARRDQYRRFFLWLCCIRLAMVFVHHQYPSFVYISAYLGLNTEDFQQTVLWFGHWYYPGAVVRLISAWFEEMSLMFITILYFIHPKVKRLFQ